MNLPPISLAGQFGRGSLRRDCVAVLLALALGLAGMGCSSIYQQSQAMLPTEPCAQLKSRIADAQHADQLASQSLITLRDRLNGGLSGAALETDTDRVAAAAFEFDRRLASARDAAAHCEGDPHLASEIERLQKRSRALMDYVQAVCRGDDSINVRQLDALIRSSANP